MVSQSHPPSTGTINGARESKVDVLVIGAGPAGVMAGNALAKAGINVRVIDKRYAYISIAGILVSGFCAYSHL